MSENTNAVCPGCKGNIKWDWCLDSYFVDDKLNIETKVGNIKLLQCPNCKEALGLYMDDTGDIVSITAYTHVDWERKENSV